MKKLYVALFTLLIPSIFALPVGSPAEYSRFYFEECCDDLQSRDFFNFGIGYVGDYVFNRHMETVNNKDIDTTQIFTNAAYIVASYCEWLEIFSSLGTSKLALNTSLGAFNAADPHPLFEIESETSFSYSIGARLTLLKYGCLGWGFQGQYFATNPNIKRLYIASGAVRYASNDLITRYSEWQVASTLAYRYNDFFLPYLAVRFGHSHWKLNDGELFVIEDNTGTRLFNLRNQRNWGYAVGLTFCPLFCERLMVTAEARFLNEKAVHVNAQMRF